MTEEAFLICRPLPEHAGWTRFTVSFAVTQPMEDTALVVPRLAAGLTSLFIDAVSVFSLGTTREGGGKSPQVGFFGGVNGLLESKVTRHDAMHPLSATRPSSLGALSLWL